MRKKFIFLIKLRVVVRLELSIIKNRIGLDLLKQLSGGVLLTFIVFFFVCLFKKNTWVLKKVIDNFS